MKTLPDAGVAAPSTVGDAEERAADEQLSSMSFALDVIDASAAPPIPEPPPPDWWSYHSSQVDCAGPNADRCVTIRPYRFPPLDDGHMATWFDWGAAAASLLGIDVTRCFRVDGPTGEGRVNVTFAATGAVSHTEIEDGPFAGTKVGACVAARFRSAHVRRFSGAPVTIRWRFDL